MSKNNSGRPEARSPEPAETVTSEKAEPISETTGVKQAPEAVPATPAIVIALSRAMQTKWSVPAWLSILACWTGSKFHANMKGANNAHGIKAIGTMQKNEEGYAWFGRIPFSYDQFGYLCVKDLGLDFSDPEACIKALKSRCPDIDKTDYKIFKEAQYWVQARSPRQRRR